MHFVVIFLTLFVPHFLMAIGTSSLSASSSPSSSLNSFNSHRHDAGFPRGILGGSSSEIDSNFICGRCQLILRSPVQANCGHRFCQVCLSILVEGRSPVICPQCQREGAEPDILTNEGFPDNAIKRILAKMEVKCVSSGCDWKGILSDYAKHEDECAFAVVGCPNDGCDTKIVRSELAKHLQTSCTKRIAKCPSCTAYVRFDDIDKHLSTACPRTEDGRRFCPFNCPDKFDDKRLETHINEKVVFHLEWVRKRLDELENAVNSQPRRQNVSVPSDATEVKNEDSEMEDLDETGPGVSQMASPPPQPLNAFSLTTPFNTPADLVRIKTEIVSLQQKIRRLEESNPRLYSDSMPSTSTTATGMPSSGHFATATMSGDAPRKVELLLRKAESYETMVTVLNAAMERLLVQFAELDGERRRERETIEGQQRKIQQLEHTLALKDVSIAEIQRRLDMIEHTSYNGTLLWKISNFLQKRQEALSGRQTSIYSPCFYTNRFGYKMCARMYLNGDGMGKGKYVSLFFVIMRSSVDALLPWPFKQKVTLMLLDQGPTGEHVIDAFRPDPNSSSFKRPVSDMNIASGCPLFVPLTMLDSNRTYIKDDTAFVKIIVDTQNLPE